MAQIVEDGRSASRRKHGALMRLRGKLVWRRFTKETGRIVGLLIAIVSFLPIMLGGGIGTWFAYTHASGRWPFETLGIVLVGMWAAWIAIPLIAASLSDSIDLENLLIYPITRRDIVISNIVGTLFDYQTYLLLPLFVSIVIGFGGLGGFSNPDSTLAMLPLTLAVVVIGYFLMVASSQLVLTALGGVLQSRRTRDVAFVLISLSGLGCWIISQAFGRVADFIGDSINTGEIAAVQPLDLLQWLPTGALARSIEQAAVGGWGTSMLWLGYALLWLLVLGWLWGALLERLLTGQGFLLGAGGGGAGAVEKKDVAKGWGLGWLSGVISAEARFIAAKELKAVWRIPQRRIGLLQAFLMPVIFAIIPFLQGNDSFLSNFELGSNARWLILSYTIILMWFLGQNMLGWEHSGLPMLLTMPMDRKRIFEGKSIAILLVGLPPLALVGIILTVLTREPSMLAWTLLGLLTALPALAVAAVASAYFPYPVQLNFKTNRSSFTRGGCLAALVILIPVPLAFVLLNLPMIVPILIAQFFPNLMWLAWVIGLATPLWAVYVFRAGIGIAGAALLKREPESIAAAKPTLND